MLKFKISKESVYLRAIEDLDITSSPENHVIQTTYLCGGGDAIFINSDESGIKVARTIQMFMTMHRNGCEDCKMLLQNLTDNHEKIKEHE